MNKRLANLDDKTLFSVFEGSIWPDRKKTLNAYFAGHDMPSEYMSLLPFRLHLYREKVEKPITFSGCNRCLPDTWKVNGLTQYPYLARCLCGAWVDHVLTNL